jgi:ribosomal protein S17E
MLPMLKLTKWFRGIDAKEFKILSEQIANSGLNKSSTVKDYVAFYNGLTPDGQKIMDKLLTNDKITREALWADIKMSMDAELPKIVDNMIPKLVAKNPKLLKDIKFFERLWVRELSTNVGALLGFGLLEMFAGDKLNNTQKQSIKQVYQYIPDSLKKELTYNLLNNKDKVGEIAEYFQPNIDNQVKGYEKLMNTTIKYSFKKAAADYVELPDDKTIGDDMSDEIMDINDLNIYRKKGWKPVSELNDDEYYDSIKMINNEMWVKLKKISDDNIEKTINDTIK